MGFEERFYASIQYLINKSLTESGIFEKAGIVGIEERRQLREALWEQLEPDLRRDVEELKKEMNVSKRSAHNGRCNGDCGCYKLIVAALAAFGFVFLLGLLV